MRFALLAVCLTAASLASSQALRHPSPPSSVVITSEAGCKPSAPVELELLDSSVSGRVAELNYSVRPTIESRSLDVRVETTDASELVAHVPADTFAIERGETRTGSARVELPADFLAHGSTIELVATITFDGAGDDGSSGVETQRVVRLVHFGAPSAPRDVTPVTSGSEVSLDMPAVRTEER